MRGQIKEKGGRQYDFRLHKHPVAGVRFCQLANDLEIGRAIPVVSGPSHITVKGTMASRYAGRCRGALDTKRSFNTCEDIDLSRRISSSTFLSGVVISVVMV
jgi:hypothetical protein